MSGFETRRLAADPDAIAPDGSEIRLVSVGRPGASMVHCTLPPGGVTHAVYHRAVEEAWYCVSGRGRLWRSSGDGDETVELGPGVGINIPSGVRFQFRNDGADPLVIVIATFPPWPGDDEAVRCDGTWEPVV